MGRGTDERFGRNASSIFRSLTREIRGFLEKHTWKADLRDTGQCVGRKGQATPVTDKSNRENVRGTSHDGW